MRRFFTLLLASLLMGCRPAARSGSPEPAPKTHTYLASDASLLNPERGFFTPYELPGPAGFSAIRITGNTLVHLNIRLDDWRATDIPQAALDGLEANFADIRDGGVKAIIRFAYNQGPYPDTEPDASGRQILRHIEQLAPLLQNNADVIAWVEAGFIGAWGEWHTSTNGLDNLTDKRTILSALLEALPETRTVQVRYPADLIGMFPDPVDAARARVAHHNDCFLSSETDVGTYEREGVITIQRDQAYLAELTRFTPMSGETCAPNPPRSECGSALPELARLHFSAINEAYHPGILRSWEQGGCMKEITDRLGYRLSLASAEFNESVRPGGVLNLTVNLRNTGFASMVNERYLYAVLVSQDDPTRYETKLDIDPRQWEPGAAALAVKLHIPSNAGQGTYQLALWLPDGYESLRGNPRYAVRFANENIWDETAGYNILGFLNVDRNAGGSYQRGAKFEVIESSLSVERSVVSLTPVAASAPTSVPSSSNELINDPSIEYDTETLVIRFEFAGEAASYNGFQVFLDTDQNPKTGMTIEGIGSDFLLENDALNAYTGSGSDWAWSPIDVELTFAKENQIAKWTLLRSALGDPANVDVVLQLVDANWDTAFVTEKKTYTLK